MARLTWALGDERQPTDEELAAYLRALCDECAGDFELVHSHADGTVAAVLEQLGYSQAVEVYLHILRKGRK
jgi:hypothetical protein